MISKIIYYVLLIVIVGFFTLLGAEQLINFSKRLRINFKFLPNFRKVKVRTIIPIFLFFFVFIFVFSLMGSRNNIKTPFVTDNYHITYGKVLEIRQSEWMIKHSFDSILVDEWKAGTMTRFDSLGNRVSQSGCMKHDCEELSYVKTIKYTDDGLVKEIKTDYEKTKSSIIYKGEFDQKGNSKSAVEYYASNGKVNRRYEFDRVKPGRKIEVLLFNSDGELEAVRGYDFWKKNILKNYSEDWVNTDRTTGLLEKFSYNRMGLQKKNEYYEFNELVSFCKTERDDRGFVVSETHEYLQSNNVEMLTTEYLELDDHGNWTKLLWYKDGFPISMFLREIKYY